MEGLGMDVALEETRLGRLTGGELRERYAALFGERSDSRNRHYLTRRILWRMQVLAEGGLSERARRHALETGSLLDIRQSAPVPRVAAAPASPDPVPTDLSVPVTVTPEPGEEPGYIVQRLAGAKTRLPPPGGVLLRRYKGKELQVHVRSNGFEWEGQTYRSLSAVAKAVTGSHWSGNVFFNLAESANARTKTKGKS